MKFWIEAKRTIGAVTKIVTCNTLVVTRNAPTLLFLIHPQREMLTDSIRHKLYDEVREDKFWELRI